MFLEDGLDMSYVTKKRSRRGISNNNDIEYQEVFDDDLEELYVPDESTDAFSCFILLILCKFLYISCFWFDINVNIILYI